MTETGDFRTRVERRDRLIKLLNVTSNKIREDKQECLWEKSKKYMAASCYKICTLRGHIDKFGKTMLKIQVLTKVQIFMWQPSMQF